MAAPHTLLPLRTDIAGSGCFGVGRSWGWPDCSYGLPRNFLPLVHALAVVHEFVLASEAVAFSIVLAPDDRTREFGRIVAVLVGSVAKEVRPAL